MKFPFFKNTDGRSSTSSWAWPSCHQPRTLSFRANKNDLHFKTINSAYNLDPTTVEVPESPKSFFTETPYESASFSTSSDDDSRGVDHIETVIRGLRSDRLFFEPDETSSILESKAYLPFKDSVVLSMASKDPYVDFRKSMEEMVQAHGVKDWESLEELLGWYLKVNGKSNYGYIVGAFVDLLVGLAFESSASSSPSSYNSSPVSCYSSNSMYSTRCVSCLEGEKEVNNAPSSSSLLLEQVKEEITHEDEDQA